MSAHPCRDPAAEIAGARHPAASAPHAGVVLRTEQLSVTYANGHQALAPLSVQFRAGEFVVLLGASGAGKSTLLRTLNGLVSPSAGRIFADGLGDIHSARNLRAHRRQTAMVFQQHHLIGRCSVLRNVLLGRLGFHHGLRALWGASRAEKQLALQAIDRLGLLDRALHRADQLSGGQQQRVGVARALVQQPRILLADEPVASLDPANAEALLARIHHICKHDGLTAIVSLHQVALARRFADRILGLRDGQLMFDGTPADLSGERADHLYRKPHVAHTSAPASLPA